VSLRPHAKSSTRNSNRGESERNWRGSIDTTRNFGKASSLMAFIGDRLPIHGWIQIKWGSDPSLMYIPIPHLLQNGPKGIMQKKIFVLENRIKRLLGCSVEEARNTCSAVGPRRSIGWGCKVTSLSCFDSSKKSAESLIISYASISRAFLCMVTMECTCAQSLEF